MFAGSEFQQSMGILLGADSVGTREAKYRSK